MEPFRKNGTQKGTQMEPKGFHLLLQNIDIE